MVEAGLPMKATQETLAEGAESLPAVATEAVYGITERTEPRRSFHLLIMIRMENERPVLTAASASQDSTGVEVSEDPGRENFATLRQTRRGTLPAAECLNDVARILFPTV